MPEVDSSVSVVPEGVRVEKFNPRAFTSMPVQIWRSDWTGTDRVLRWVGHCRGCDRPTWEADDGGNDPRGVLGDHATHALSAVDYGMVGPDAPLCAMCGNEDEPYSKALAYAKRKLWKHPETEVK